MAVRYFQIKILFYLMAQLMKEWLGKHYNGSLKYICKFFVNIRRIYWILYLIDYLQISRTHITL